MKKGLIVTLLVALFAISIGGATFALFTDSATNAPNTFRAGTVDIDSYRDGFDTIPGPMFYTNEIEGATPTDPSYPGLKPTGLWAPGDSHVRSLIVYNKGTLDAVLDQVKANTVRDDQLLREHMDVAIYKILPKFTEGGATFTPIPGDDTFDKSVLDTMSEEFNPILMEAWALDKDPEAGGSYGMNQLLIEKDIPLNAQELWKGSFTQLEADYQTMSPVYLRKTNVDYMKRGTLLAFVVTLRQDTPNEHQGARDVIYDFSVGARQAP